MRGFPQVEDLTQDEVDDSDVMGDRPQAGEVSEVGSASPYHTVMIQSYHLLHQLTHSLMNWNLSRCCFACVGCFLVCLVLCLCVFVFLCFCVLCAFGVFVLFLLCLGDYIVTVHRTT